MAGIWYRTGTVALTNGSKRVTGTGTTWLAQAVGPVMGNTFWGPDNKPYEVERVISNTELDLVEPYAGTTIASTPYKINTTEKFSVASLAGQVAATLQYAQAQYSNMSLWASGDLPADVPVVLPDGVTTKDVPNVAKMLTLIAAKLTETAQLKALDVPSSVFGRGRLADADAAAQLTALGVKKAGLVDILGTLTAPGANGLTSAIIERGGNANGTYVKFADGTMICQTSSYSTEAFFATSVSGLSEWNFDKPLPAAFNGVFACAGSGNDSVNIGHFTAFRLTDTSARCSYRSMGAPGSRSVVLQSVFIGRWYA